jgi:GWxTD domain-containing protein
MFLHLSLNFLGIFNRKPFFRGIVLLLTGVMATACNQMLFVTNNRVETWNYKKWHGPRQVIFSAINADSVCVFLEIDPAVIPVERNFGEESYKVVRYSVGVFSDFRNDSIIDSSRVEFLYSMPQEAKSFIEKVHMKAPAGKDYFLWIKPQRQEAGIYSVQRSTCQSDAEWLLTSQKGDAVLNPENLLVNPFVIRSNSVGNKSVFIRRFQMGNCLPQPPFVTYPARCPAILNTVGILSINENQTAPMILPGGGIYLLQTDTSQPGAKILNVFDEKTLQWVVRYALRYITTAEEWTALEEGRMEPWDFWESIAGSTQRALQLSSVFRRAVEESCRLFSEDFPGALTDRGMVYLVFGTPASVVTSKTIETWTYAPTDNTPPLVFDFDIHVTRHGILQYQLRRKPEWRQPWMQAVERYRR